MHNHAFFITHTCIHIHTHADKLDNENLINETLSLRKEMSGQCDTLGVPE